jgi:uronate dehydrogenase
MEDPRRHVVLVTGAGGSVGQAVVRALRAAGHTVRGLDLDPPAEMEGVAAGDLAKPGVAAEAVRSVGAVIHLAAYPTDADLVEDLLQPNVVGLHRVLEACREADVRRVVLASSMQVVQGLEDQAPLDGDHVNPCNHYALTKCWAEVAGEMYARLHGMSVIAARIGWLPRTVKRALRVPEVEATDIYLSDRDAGRFFTCAVEAELEPHAFHVLYAVSRPAGEPRVDAAVAHRVIGYGPQDTYPEGYRTDNKKAASDGP